MSITLRWYQDEIIVGARDALREKKKRILIQAPCGAGKTVIASFITKNAVEKGGRVMFLTHREELAIQASKTYTRIGVEHGLIMAGVTPQYNLPVQVAMIDTLRNRLDKVKVPRIIIVDETHHAVAPSWRKVLDYFAERGSVIIGLSATPERLDGRGLGEIFQVIIPGPPVRTLIECGALSDYTYYAPPSFVDESSLKMSYGDYDRKALEAASDKPQIIGSAVEHYKKLLAGEGAIVFAVTIAHSKHIVEQFNAAGIPAAHVDGDTPAAERKRAIKDFAAGRYKILSNVSLFGEGFDVPSCAGVIVLRKTASRALHIQMSMRPMRPYDGKTKAIIVDCVGNIRHGLPDEEFEWSLDAKKRSAKKKKDDDEEDVKVAQCPKCYFCHEPAPVCPHCGHVYEVKVRKIEQVDGDLKEVTQAVKEERQRQRMREQGNARTVEELIATGRSRYAAEKIVAARAEKAEIIAALTADLVAWQQLTGEKPYPIFGVSYRDIRYMKPKELKALREKFEQHKLEYANEHEDFALCG